MRRIAFAGSLRFAKKATTKNWMEGSRHGEQTTSRREENRTRVR
jgi:hypothetical protein